jgi:hypothetical protein
VGLSVSFEASRLEDVCGVDVGAGVAGDVVVVVVVDVDGAGAATAGEGLAGAVVSSSESSSQATSSSAVGLDAVHVRYLYTLRWQITYPSTARACAAPRSR